MKMQRNITKLFILLLVVILISDLAASYPCKGKKKRPKHPPKSSPVYSPLPINATSVPTFISILPVSPTDFPVVPPPIPPPGYAPPPEIPSVPSKVPSPTPPPEIPPGGGEAEVHSGDGTFFTPDLGACGARNDAGSMIVALAAPDFDKGNVDGNPNHNKICGRKIRVFRNGKSADATVADRCPECKSGDVDMSPAVFNLLAEPVEGRVPVTWKFLD